MRHKVLFVQTDEDAPEQSPVKPKSVVINLPQHENLLSAAPATRPANGLAIQHTAKTMPEQSQRILLTSVALFISMFFNWGYQYWLKWTVDWPENGDGGGWDDGSHTNLWNYIVHGDFASEGGIGLVEMLNFFHRFQIWGDVADLAGTVFVLFMMRELMPFVLIGTLVFCWSNREREEEFFQKVTMFWVGYFTVMTIQLSLITIQFSGHDYWEFNALLDCFGFWLAGFAGLLLHPKRIPIPENFGFRKDTFTPHLNQPEWTQTAHGMTNAPKREANFLVFAGLYFPLIYHFITVTAVMGGGDDDALFLGIVLPIVGLLVGIGVYRLEFLKGFGIHLGYSIGYGFMAYVLMIIGLLESVVDALEEGTILLFFVVAFIMPIRYHLKSKHIRALGATYTIPLTIWIMFIGLIIGWFQVDGFF